MSHHCPSHDWDAEIERQERAANSMFICELQEIAVRMMAGLAANPSMKEMAYSDQAEIAFEMAAEVISHAGALEGWFSRRGSGKGDDWESRFWAKYEELVP